MQITCGIPPENLTLGTFEGWARAQTRNYSTSRVEVSDFLGWASLRWQTHTYTHTKTLSKAGGVKQLLIGPITHSGQHTFSSARLNNNPSVPTLTSTGCQRESCWYFILFCFRLHVCCIHVCEKSPLSAGASQVSTQLLSSSLWITWDSESILKCVILAQVSNNMS